MNYHFEYPAGFDSQFHCPEPEGMHGVMGSDPNRVEFEVSHPVVKTQTAANVAWRKHLADACKGAR